MHIRLWFGAVLGWLMTPLLVGEGMRMDSLPLMTVAWGIAAAVCGLLIEFATGDSLCRHVGAFSVCTVALAIPVFLYSSSIQPPAAIISASVVALSFFSACRASRLLCNLSAEKGIVRPSSRDAEFAEWEIHREIQRARRFDRPLSLVLLTINDRQPSQTARDSDRSYSTNVSRLLAGHIKSCDLLVRMDGQFVLILPETRVGDAEVAVHRLQFLIREQLDCDSQYAVAGFPDEEPTITGLWDLVLQRLRKKRTPSPDLRSIDASVAAREEPTLVRR